LMTRMVRTNQSPLVMLRKRYKTEFPIYSRYRLDERDLFSTVENLRVYRIEP
jgi:hypothetical protein